MMLAGRPRSLATGKEAALAEAPQEIVRDDHAVADHELLVVPTDLDDLPRDRGRRRSASRAPS
jgi:hypothetical protein